MGVVAATLVPLVLLGLLELGLRIAGFGASTRLFLPSTIEGKEFFIPNEKFTTRFFPASLARVPLSSRMAAQKPQGTYRIFLLGESAAYGDPDPSFGMGRYLESLLEARYPTTDFELVNVAITAINSHVILPIARECARHEGDLWVIYMGNNEMIGPYGASTVFGRKAPTIEWVRAVLAIKSTRLGQLMDQAIAGIQSRHEVPKSWAGIEMFRKNPLRYDDPGRMQVYTNFKTNLSDILRVGKQAGVPVVLSTVPSNLKDCSPFVSLHSPDLTNIQRAQWEDWFTNGKRLEKAGNFQAALDHYAKAAAMDSSFAELQFRTGTCMFALKNFTGAHEAFTRARDCDALVVRADTRINEIIAEAIEGNLVAGVDSVESLSQQSPNGIPGQELFYEHVHLTQTGNFKLARALADAVETKIPEQIAKTRIDLTLDQEAKACEQRLAATVWDEKRLWDVALGRISTAPFTAQSSHSRNLEYCKLRMKAVDAKTTRHSPLRDQRMYEAALARAPEDTLVRWNYAQFLERTGRLPDATAQGKSICQQLPHASWPHYFVGSILARQGKTAEAEIFLQRALDLTPNLENARKELARIRRIRK